MKKFLQLTTAAALMFTATCATAQTKAKDWTVTDLKGKSHNLFSYLDKGYAVYVDISATWCGPCWSYHNTHAMGKAWETNGPAGEPGVSATTKNNMIQFLIEADPSTAKSELSKSSRDWTKGTNYPIVDLTSAQVSALKSAGIAMPYYPAGTFICPDRTLTKGEAIDQRTAAQLVALQAKCKPFTTGIEKVNNQISSMLVYPNPANSVANVEFTLTENSSVSIEMINAIGQVVLSQQLGNVMGDQKAQLNVSTLSKGLYFVNVIAGDNKIIRKISIEK